MDAAVGQTADEHSAHHPPSAAAGPNASTSPPGPQPQAPAASSASPMQMMQSMMEGMGSMHGPPRRELYPTLMALPELTPEARAAIATEAERRLRKGTDGLRGSADGIAAAGASNDASAMAAAIERLHEAATDLETATAARRALASASQPRDVARDWFKRNLNIMPSTATERPTGAFGMSWMHLSAMTAVVLAATWLAWIYIRRMRRAAMLFGTLAQDAAAPGAPTTRQPAPAAQPVAQQAPATAQATAATLAVATPPTTRWSGRLRLASIFRETPSAKTFRFVHPSGGDVPFIHLPGQFVTIEASVAGKALKRSYTIASAPTQRRYIELTIKREDQGAVSRHMHDVVKVGNELAMAGPSGVFTFTGTESDSIVLIAGGVGITPMMSVVRHLTDSAWSGEIFLLYACRTYDEFIFAEEIQYLQRRHPNLQVLACMTQVEGAAWAGPRGRLTKSLIADTVPEIARRRIHLCGPPAMMDAMKAILSELGAPPRNVRTEAFGPAVSPAIRVPAVAAAVADARQVPLRAATVTFNRSGKSAPLPSDATILEVADALGIWIDNSCRSGTCGTCKVKLVSGSVTMAARDGLSESEEREGLILACQAKSLGDVVVEA